MWRHYTGNTNWSTMSSSPPSNNFHWRYNNPSVTTTLTFPFLVTVSVSANFQTLASIGSVWTPIWGRNLLSFGFTSTWLVHRWWKFANILLQYFWIFLLLTFWTHLLWGSCTRDCINFYAGSLLPILSGSSFVFLFRPLLGSSFKKPILKVTELYCMNFFLRDSSVNSSIYFL